MAFEIEKLLNDIANSKSLNSIFNNPIYTAIIIVSMVLVIIYFTFRNDVVIKDNSESSMITLMFTAGIYCILTVLGLVYLQHRSMVKDFEQKYAVRNLDEIVNVATDKSGAAELATLDVFNPKPALVEDDNEFNFENNNGSENLGHDSSEDSSEKNARIREASKPKFKSADGSREYTKKERKERHKKDDDDIAP
jgi:hypothetical protein